MYLSDLGLAIRSHRQANGLTQAELAERAQLSRTTVNQLENGVFPDIGVRKLVALLNILGQDLEVVARKSGPTPDFLRMAATSASVGYRTPLTPEGLAQIVLSGKVPTKFRPHLRALLDEAPVSVLEGLIDDLASGRKRIRIQRNLSALAAEVGSPLRVAA